MRGRSAADSVPLSTVEDDGVGIGDDGDNDVELPCVVGPSDSGAVMNDDDEPGTASKAPRRGVGFQLDDDDDDVITDFPELRVVMPPRRCRLLAPGSIAASAFNLASGTLGAGTLAVPFSMVNAGVGTCTGMLILSCAGTVASIRYLARAAEATGCHTFEDLAYHTMGRAGRIAATATIVVFCMGCAVLYVVMMGDVLEVLSHDVEWMPKVLRGRSGRNGATALYWLLFMMPLSLLRRIDALRYASLVGSLSTLCLVVAMGVDAARYGTVSNVSVARWDSAAWAALPTLTFCFCCQTNTFEILEGLQRASSKRMTIVAGLSSTTCTVIYVLAGVFGVMQFGTTVHANVLTNYSDISTNPLMLVATVGVTVTLTMAFPCVILPSRDSILQAFGVPALGPLSEARGPTSARIVISLSLALAALVAGCLTSTIAVLIAVTGGVTGAGVAFVFPAIIALRTGVAESTVDVGLCVTLLAVGVVMGVASSVLAVTALLDGGVL